MHRFVCFRIMPFYAVRTGRKPGVYKTWDECKAQVNKFDKARYKKFPTLSEAQEFVKGTDDGGYIPTTPKLKNLSSTSEARATGRNAAAIKVVQNSLLNINQNLEQIRTFVSQAEDSLKVLEQNCRKRETSSTETSETISNKRQKYDNTSFEHEYDADEIVVYTDGSCVNNGFSGARAGIGVYWGPGDPRNLSERLSGRQTNNRAEIYAATRAIQQAKEAGIDRLTIKTDSQFLINCITKWMPKWKTNGWKLAGGGTVQNRIELEEIDRELDSSVAVQWVHVRGHQGHAGNEEADRLANEGAAKPNFDSEYE